MSNPVDHRLARLLDTPLRARVVLRSLLDLDLWRHAGQGRDEQFDGPKPTHSGASTAATIKGNPIVTAYFRAAHELLEASNETPRSPERDAHATGLPESFDAVARA